MEPTPQISLRCADCSRALEMLLTGQPLRALPTILGVLVAFSLTVANSFAQVQNIPPGYYRNDPPVDQEIPPEVLEQFNNLFKNTPSASPHFCAITVTQNGRLVAGIGNQELNSSLAGGTAGVADVTATNSSFEISIDQPTGFTSAPANGNDNTTFSSTYSGFGKTNFSSTPGDIPVRLKKGITTVETHFIATRTPDAFPAGNYNGELVLRCE